MISFYTLYNVYLPANLTYFLKALMETVFYDVIPERVLSIFYPNVDFID